MSPRCKKYRAAYITMQGVFDMINTETNTKIGAIQASTLINFTDGTNSTLLDLYNDVIQAKWGLASRAYLDRNKNTYYQLVNKRGNVYQCSIDGRMTNLLSPVPESYKDDGMDLGRQTMKKRSASRSPLRPRPPSRSPPRGGSGRGRARR